MENKHIPKLQKFEINYFIRSECLGRVPVLLSVLRSLWYLFIFHLLPQAERTWLC